MLYLNRCEFLCQEITDAFKPKTAETHTKDFNVRVNKTIASWQGHQLLEVVFFKGYFSILSGRSRFWRKRSNLFVSPYFPNLPPFPMCLARPQSILSAFGHHLNSIGLLFLNPENGHFSLNLHFGCCNLLPFLIDEEEGNHLIRLQVSL